MPIVSLKNLNPEVVQPSFADLLENYMNDNKDRFGLTAPVQPQPFYPDVKAQPQVTVAQKMVPKPAGQLRTNKNPKIKINVHINEDGRPNAQSHYLAQSYHASVPLANAAAFVHPAVNHHLNDMYQGHIPQAPVVAPVSASFYPAQNNAPNMVNMPLLSTNQNSLQEALQKYSFAKHDLNDKLMERVRSGTDPKNSGMPVLNDGRVNLIML
eukprot:gene12223-13483_t